MRKQVLIFSLLGGLCFFAGAGRSLAQQQTPSQAVAAEDESARLEKWKVINSGIFLLVLGFAVVKFAPKFFQARSLDIQKAIKDATGLKIEADFRYSEVDKKMSHLAEAVARLKAEAAAEMEREHQRIQQETAEEVAHLERNTNFEIEYLRDQGALQVKQHTAQLALALAERRLQAHFAQTDGQNNIKDFVHLVETGRNAGSNN